MLSMYRCKLGIRPECISCGECFEKPVLIDVDGVEIYDGDTYYDVGGEIYAEETMESCRRTAEKEEGAWGTN